MTFWQAMFGPPRPIAVAWVRPGYYMLVDRDESLIPEAPGLPPSRKIHWEPVPFALGYLLSLVLGEIPRQTESLKLRRSDSTPDTKNPFIA